MAANENRKQSTLALLKNKTGSRFEGERGRRAPSNGGTSDVLQSEGSRRSLDLGASAAQRAALEAHDPQHRSNELRENRETVQQLEQALRDSQQQLWATQFALEQAQETVKEQKGQLLEVKAQTEVEYTAGRSLRLVENRCVAHALNQDQ